jgi:replicative DNA helicase
MPVEYLPPQDAEAEASCLSSVLLSKDALIKVIEILQPEDFYLDAHRSIFKAIHDLERKNLPIDLITVKQRLQDLGQLEKVGGDGALVDLYRTSATSANAEYYARRIKEMSLRRRLI